LAVDIEIRGLEELERDFEDVYRKYPDETVQEIFKQGGNFRDDTIAKMPSSYSKGKRPLNSKKEWERKREKGDIGATIGVSVRCKAPHFHLVENGHAKWLNGKNTGEYVPGKFYAKRTRAEYVHKFPEAMAKFVDRMLKERGL
jgi:hypothetical protein